MDFNRLLKTFKKGLKLPAVGCALVAVVASCVVLALRSGGWLQRIEVSAYDRFVRSFAKPESRDPRIVLVGMTEDDLVKLGFPIDDEKLAEILTRIDAQGPVTIGLDMYRDLPEPRSGALYPKFEATAKKLERLVAIERVGFVKPPPALVENPERIAGNNIGKDESVDGYYRRAPLFIEIGPDESRPSLSLAMTVAYLSHKGIGVEFSEGKNEETGETVQLIKLGPTLIPRFTANAGGYVKLGTIKNYEYLNDFRGPYSFRSGTFTSFTDLGQFGRDTPYDYSFGEVLAGTVPADAFKDKIVLLATVMQSIKDSNPTPVEDNLRGVQQHIVMINQLLRMAEGERPMGWWPEWAEALYICVTALLGSVLSLVLRSPWKLVPALALLIGGIFGGAWFAFEHRTWLLVGAPLIATVLGTALMTSYVVALERADRAVVQSLFSKHVSKKVADALIEQRDQFIDGGKMAPRAFTGTVVFTDLAGFSTASEKLTAHQVMRWLNDYMEVMGKLVETYEGTINKYIGDAIMAIFGAPIVHQDDVGVDADAVRAIRCALHMRQQVPVLNATWLANSPELPPVAMRVGIFTGPLVDGSFGSADRLEWTVIGDTVNRANRLEAAGKEIKDQLTEAEKSCPILIGPETFKRVGHLFETAPVENLALKGITERVTIYRVLAERAPSKDQQKSST